MIKIYCFKSNLYTSDNNVYSITNNPDDCDFIFFSYKIHKKRHKIKYVGIDTIDIVSEAYNLALKHKKKLVFLCGGDRPPIILPNNKNVIILNNSVNKNNKQDNELVIGVEVEDKFVEYLKTPLLSVGFVGAGYNFRRKYLTQMEADPDLTTNFIIRDRYIMKLKQRQKKDFVRNMNNNLFTFCMRGAGNFSVRFYETLMMGRIPIVVKTDSIFPFEDKIDYKKVGIFIEESDLENEKSLCKIIIDYFNEKTKDELLEIQKSNRNLYLKYFHKKTIWEQMFLNILLHTKIR